MIWFIGATGLGIIALVSYSFIYYMFFNEFKLFVKRATHLLNRKRANH